MADERPTRQPFDPTGFAAFFPSMVVVAIACLAIALLAASHKVGTWILALALLTMIAGVATVATFMDRITTNPSSGVGPVERGPMAQDTHGDLSPHDLPRDHPARADLVRLAQERGSPGSAIDLSTTEAVEHKAGDLARGQ